MKDYEVNYVHQESKTIPDANYTFETAMTPAHLPRHEPIPTHKDVLLKTWAQDTEAMASRMIGYDESESKFFTTNIDGEITNRYEHVRLALEAQIAYLNSAAEVSSGG